MKVFVAGGTGATGRLLVSQLLQRGAYVRAVVRSLDRVPSELEADDRLSLVEGNLLELSDAQFDALVSGCDAAASCLGHTMSFRGMFGPPHRLVTDATRRLCRAFERANANGPRKFVLMSTNANQNRDLHERLSIPDKLVISILGLLLPPQQDNVAAAEFLRTQIGPDHRGVQWVAVRPDGLVDEPAVSDYAVHPSPTRGVIFGSGRTSRINVAHFMAKLITDDDEWNRWRGRMPVIYNEETSTR